MISSVPHIAVMDSYALADLSAPQGKRLTSLSQNESLRPPSPLAVEAAEKAARDLHLYPDPDWTALREAIGAIHDIDPALILCGNGSLDLINCIARAYLAPGRAALTPSHSYPFFRTATLASGARFDTAPCGLWADIDGLLDAVRTDTDVVFIANPGNPTGTRVSRRDLIRLRDGLPGDVLLVIDEAYGEFADHLSEPVFDDLAGRGDTVILRTLSKAYGLAGARVGWGLMPQAIGGELRKLLNPNNASGPSQAAATAAMRDQAYMRETCRLTAEIRDGFAKRVAALGLELPQSFTNFSLIRFASARAAAAADSALRAEGVFLRPQGTAGLPDCLRATAGVADDMDFTATLLEDWVKGKGWA